MYESCKLTHLKLFTYQEVTHPLRSELSSEYFKLDTHNTNIKKKNAAHFLSPFL